MNIKTVEALVRLRGNIIKPSLGNCCDICPHCKETFLTHKDPFFKGESIYATGFCLQCGWIDPKIHFVYTIKTYNNENK